MRELSIRHHLEELRRRLTISALAALATTVVAFVFHRQILNLLIRPSDLEAATGGEAGLVFVEVTEMLAVTLKVSLVSGLVMAFPIILLQVIMF
ncbi:MAG: twin-arginine translocase subunit TatC, partial [Dehalococcoidia bacterium]|nr:twin-arginine translocase subunit TatC [Dehalococcoidia bacterium]